MKYSKQPIICFGLLLLFIAAGESFGQVKKDDEYRPKDGEFPSFDKSKAFRGELVFVDPINRRGSLRLHVDGHFHEGRLHHFAMLPYGIIRYRGAPAELRDVPVGTVLYGHFFLPPDPRTSAVPIVRGNDVTQPKENYAILLEDGMSLCLREKQSWKMKRVVVNGSNATLTASLSSAKSEIGLVGDQKFTIDASTRFWRGREVLGIDELIAEGAWPGNGAKDLSDQSVQLGLAWHARYLYQQFHLSDVWLDDKSIEVARERQRQRHIRHIKTRWMPAKVDTVEYGKFGQAKVTITLFGGMDESLYADFKSGIGGKMAAAENTLRTWWPDHDGMDGRIIAVTRSQEKVPTGSSGIQVQFEVPLILEGFRPGRIVRIRPQNWPNAKPPVEEQVRSFEDRWPSPDIFKGR